MNEQTRQALEMAKEFIGGLDLKISKGLEACMVIDEIDEALAQPTQEPVAWNEEEFNAIAYAYRTCPAHEIKMVSDRYQELVNYVLSITRPAPSKKWVGLSGDDREDIKGRICQVDDAGSYIDPDFAMIEAERMLKDKNHD